MFRGKLIWLGTGLVVLAAGLSVLAQGTYQAPQQAPIQQAPFQAPFPNQGGGNEYFAANLGIWYRLVPYGYGGGGGGGFTSNQGNYDPNSPPGNPGGFQQAPFPQPQAPLTYGARLSRYPVADSPCAFLQLEPGDMIVSLDNQPFYNANNVLSHYGQTSMVFVNVRTGQPQAAEVNLP